MKNKGFATISKQSFTSKKKIGSNSKEFKWYRTGIIQKVLEDGSTKQKVSNDFLIDTIDDYETVPIDASDSYKEIGAFNRFELTKRNHTFLKSASRNTLGSLCGGTLMSTPFLIPAKEELNSLIFRQDTVLKLHQFITNNKLGTLASNVKIDSISINPLITFEDFKKNNPGITSSRTLFTNEIEGAGTFLQEVSLKQRVIPSKNVCRRVGCGIVASIQTNQLIRDRLVKFWISQLSGIPGFPQLFNLKSKQLSVNSRQEPKNRNSRFKHTVVLFLPYKSQQLSQPTKN